MEIEPRTCPLCGVNLPVDCFRKHAKACVWCVFAAKDRRAAARYRDKLKMSPGRVAISLAEFVRWYGEQPDACAYCGLTFAELRELRIRRRGGYCVGWDIDRVDSLRPYEPGNLAQSCFVCNMAKGDVLSATEARVIGQAVRRLWDERLRIARGA